MNVIMQYAYEYTLSAYICIGPSLLMTITDSIVLCMDRTVLCMTVHITILSISTQPMAMD